MDEWITEKLKSLKEDLSKKQELFKINVSNIASPTYEDNTINDLLVMKKLKTEIEQLELMSQVYKIFSGEKVYELAMKNTTYNKNGKAVISSEDEWVNESEWDDVFEQIKD